MIELDYFSNPKPLSINVLRVDESVLGCIDDIIDDKTASLNIGLNEQYELTFDATKNDNSNWYDYLNEGMYLSVENVGLFKMRQPDINNDGAKEKKSIHAYSCDSELEDKNIELQINVGIKSSKEYLVSYEDGETENLVNPYTGIPYDWIVLYNTFPEQLSAFKTLFESGHFGDPDESGDTSVTDADLIEELGGTLSLFPRLINKITYVDNEDGSKDSVLTEYVIITYNTTDPSIVDEYVLTNQFDERITELITYYTKYHKQLSLLDIVLEKTGGDWTVGSVYGLDNDDYSLANMKYQFDINESIYSFLTHTLAETTNCVLTFDIQNRKVNMTPIEEVGDDTGIVMSYDNLVNSLDIGADEDTLSTRLVVSGGDELDITRVNFGINYVDDITYKLNAVGEDGKRIYVSDELANKYMSYIEYREDMRQQYIQLSKDYESYSEQILEIENRVPNDSIKTDWSTFSMEELTAALTTFKNLLVTLKSLYKEEYGTEGLNPDGSIKESFIRETAYWYDYFAYNTTIDEIQCAIDVFPYYNDTDQWTDSQKAEYEEKIKAWETEWSLYGTKELKAKIDTYQQNMDLMLTKNSDDPDNSKSAVIPKYPEFKPIPTDNILPTDGYPDAQSTSAYTITDNQDGSITVSGSGYDEIILISNDLHQQDEQLAPQVGDYILSIEGDDSVKLGAILSDGGAIQYGSIKITDGTVLDDIKIVLVFSEESHLDNVTIRPIMDSEDGTQYIIKTFDELTDDERSQYGNLREKYPYDAYMDFYNNRVDALEYLSGLNVVVDELKSSCDTAQEDRKEIVHNVSIENYTVQGEPVFTSAECKVIYRLFRDAEYSNENIVSTSIDTSSQKIDTMVELLEDAKDQASLVSRPQLTFSVDSDNLLALEEFKELWSSFLPGNYILVQYRDNTYVKVRMLGFKFNPRVPAGDGFEIRFSNFVRSRAYYRDWASIFGNDSSSISSYGSSGGGSGDGVYGESDDIDVTISNTMLAKLLNTEMFGSRVTDIVLDTIDVNKLTARMATFGGLANGSTTVDGKCITTGYIKSYGYDGSDGSVDNKNGSIINLDTGAFNFAGGKIVYDGVNFDIYTNNLHIGPEGGEKTISEAMSDKLDILSSVETTGTHTKSGSVAWDGSKLKIQSVKINDETQQSDRYGVEIGGDGIDFKYSDSAVASINQDRLIIGKTVVVDEMQVGIQRSSGSVTGGQAKWSWKYNPNDDSLYLKWIGV